MYRSSPVPDIPVDDQPDRQRTATTFAFGTTWAMRSQKSWTRSA